MVMSILVGGVLKISKYTLEQIKLIIKSMVMVVDTRENVNHHITNYFKKNEIPYITRKLCFGDYSFFTTKNQIVNRIGNFTNYFSIERKNSLSEICLNFTTPKKKSGLPDRRKRFEREFIRVKEAEAKIILMIEDKEENIDLHKYRSKIHPKALRGSLDKWSERYDFHIEFINKEKSGWYIYNTCKQYLEEYLTKL